MNVLLNNQKRCHILEIREWKSLYVLCVASFQSVHAAAESKPAVKRNQKPGKKPGGKSGKEGSKKSHNSTGETAFCSKIRVLSPCSRDLTILSDLSSMCVTQSPSMTQLAVCLQSQHLSECSNSSSWLFCSDKFWIMLLLWSVATHSVWSVVPLQQRRKDNCFIAHKHPFKLHIEVTQAKVETARPLIGPFDCLHISSYSFRCCFGV